VDGVLAAATGSQVEAVTRTRDEPIRAVVADTLAEVPTGVATLAGPTVAEAMVAAITAAAATTAEEAITVEEAITAEEVITAVAATGIMAPVSVWALDSTARPTATDTGMPPDIAARPATMISTEIGFLQVAPHIPTKRG
jgi:hypothetical protein